MHLLVLIFFSLLLAHFRETIDCTGRQFMFIFFGCPCIRTNHIKSLRYAQKYASNPLPFEHISTLIHFLIVVVDGIRKDPDTYSEAILGYNPFLSPSAFLDLMITHIECQGQTISLPFPILPHGEVPSNSESSHSITAPRSQVSTLKLGE